ncbi:MAG: hypothetical protein IIB17_07580 [Chloroflexi bacterium]|nr:hypothetical protein [Chloroflexota bacterium]
MRSRPTRNPVPPKKPPPSRAPTLVQGPTSGLGCLRVEPSEALEQGLIQPGSNVLLCGFGAGLAWGTVVLRW